MILILVLTRTGHSISRFEQRNGIDSYLSRRWVKDHIADMVACGWPRERAELLRLLMLGRNAFAKALSERDGRYAASTYALSEALFAQRGAQRHRPAGRFYYRHVEDPTRAITTHAHSLAEDDAAWRSLETPDATGFRGLTCRSALSVDGGADAFVIDGFCDVKGSPAAESDVVCFESAPDDALGAHAPVPTGEHIAVFPPNTLFRLKRVDEPGSWEAPGGLRPRRRLLVVSATYQKPRSALSSRNHGGKMCESVVTLQYGNRDAFVRGLDDILARPALTMAQEFARDHTWTDWKGGAYSLREEWAYVSGAAVATPGCTPGTRDADNGGKTPVDFMEEVNAHIRRRREQAEQRGGGAKPLLLEKDAFLTLDEVLAIRLYSGPSYQPINTFLRSVSTLRGDARAALASHAGLTFAATVRYIIQGIRKLSAVTTEEESSRPLWRGVRGELPPSFWMADKAGMVVAVDMAFMSTSRLRQTPIDYMSTAGENVLWALKAQPESDSGYHCGADIGMLSQFAAEAEVLYPPCTMLTVLRPGRTESQDGGSVDHGRPSAAGEEAAAAAASHVDEGDKRFLCVDVLPSFV